MPSWSAQNAMRYSSVHTLSSGDDQVESSNELFLNFNLPLTDSVSEEWIGRRSPEPRIPSLVYAMTNPAKPGE